eukprot:TRINITY_DN4533_c0_g1_i1.p1 TRINITY_DN4533_c0_g1~~TRINITY_DN4533_c0_g1_i1.p1  ORF type:complete len:813 (-),score=189.10 TRINITY_DN4533_c0_g1_i1:7-2268(-)
MKSTGLDVKLKELFTGLNIDNIKQLVAIGRKAREMIMEAPFPAEFQKEIEQGYRDLCARYGRDANSCDVDVAVRSSATAEDLPDASFAGQQESYLNVHSTTGVVDAVHKCFASVFTDRAISYRTLKNFDHFAVALSVGVQKMVRSDLSCSGVCFSIDTESGFSNAVLVTASYGLGENIVQGAVNPDEYFVFKPTLKEGFNPILKKTLGSKEMRMIYAAGGGKLTKNVPVPNNEREKYCLDDTDILTLAKWTCIIEDHYTDVHGHWTPMDIEWARDGLTNQLFVVQARPETVQSHKNRHVLQTYKLTQATTEEQAMTKGRSVGEMIGSGFARVVLDVHDIDKFQPGEVLVTNRTDPDWEPIMKKAAAVVTNQGGRTCHAAIIARELGIPAIVGSSTATAVIKTGEPITIVCSEGEVGTVYKGIIPYTVEETVLDQLPKLKTKIMMNMGNPDEALSLSTIPNCGIGLARLEFIIANIIRVHPLALIYYDRLDDPHVKAEIAKMTQHYATKPDFFVDRLASGIAMIAAAFYPNPVIVRMSDFKTNEYANLLGGRQFEPKEENPMIGWRGASRYYDPKYREGFALECKAFIKARNQMGLKNIIPMIPFCRTVEEGKKVIAEMDKHGLRRGEDGLQVYVMCEIPSNVILAEQFSEVFDGFSIGSNDLTQLTLGLDRDSGLVAHIFDERNPAVKELIKTVIQKAKNKGRKVGICGQAPSDYPEFARFLVSEGIDSISLNPDSVLKTWIDIAKFEATLQN